MDVISPFRIRFEPGALVCSTGERELTRVWNTGLCKFVDSVGIVVGTRRVKRGRLRRHPVGHNGADRDTQCRKPARVGAAVRQTYPRHHPGALVARRQSFLNHPDVVSTGVIVRRFAWKQITDADSEIDVMRRLKMTVVWCDKSVEDILLDDAVVVADSVGTRVY